MLVFTTKATQSILIAPEDHLDPTMTVRELFADGPIEITVQHLARTEARLGIQAPMRLRVNRAEVEGRRPLSFRLASIIPSD